MNKTKEIEWRRGMVLRLSSQGYKQDDIATIMQLSQPVVSRDLNYLKKRAQENVEHYITEQIPETIDKAFTILDWLLTQCSQILTTEGDKKTKLDAIRLMKDIQHSKLDLLTNTTIAKEIMRDWKQKQEKLLSKQRVGIVTYASEEEENEFIEDKETKILQGIDEQIEETEEEEEEGPDPEQ